MNRLASPTDILKPTGLSFVMRDQHSLERVATRVSPSAPKVRVLYVIDQLLQIGGAERVLLEILQRLPFHGYEGTVVTFQVNPELKALEKISPSLRVFPLRKTYDLNALRAAHCLRKLIRTEKFSIVHTFFETADIWAAPIAKLSGCPILVSSRRDMGILRKRKHQLAYPFVNRIFDRVLAVSNEVRNYAMRHDGLAPGAVRTLYNGVDLEMLNRNSKSDAFCMPQGIIPGDLIVSTLANVRHVKGIDVLIRAAAVVCAQHPRAKFLVVGGFLEDETYSRLQELIASLGLRERFLFTGPMTNPYPILGVSDVFCLPSRNEGFSNALIEAMGSSLPCVATRVGGNAEAVTNGKEGFIVESEDVQAIGEKLSLLLSDSELRRRMGHEARKTVENRFSMNAMMAGLLGIYEELLAGKNA